MIWKPLFFAMLLAWHASAEITCSNGTWIETNVIPNVVMGTGSLVCQPPPGAVQIGGSFGAALQPNAAKPNDKATPKPTPFDVETVIKAIQSTNLSERYSGRDMVLIANQENTINDDIRHKLIHSLLPLARARRKYNDDWSTPMVAIDLLGHLKATEAIPTLFGRLSERLSVFGTMSSLPVAAKALYNIGDPAIGPMLERAGTLGDTDWQTLTYVMQRFDEKKPVVRQAMRAYLDATVGVEAPAPVTEAEKAQRALVKSRLEKFLATREPRRPKPKVNKPKPVKPAVPAPVRQ